MLGNHSSCAAWRPMATVALATVLTACGGPEPNAVQADMAQTDAAQTGATQTGATAADAAPTDALAPDTTTDAATDTATAADTTDAASAMEHHFFAAGWADNWFALYAGDTLVLEDPVPITTVKSFNAATGSFTGKYPLTLSFVLKDYIENDSGLEYIGTPKQQIGDGGFVFQLTDTDTQKVVSVSSKAWKCKAIHRAPLNAECVKDAQPAQACKAQIDAEPTGWKSSGFDDSDWPAAVEHSAADVGPKEGYYDVKWDAAARFVWSADLKIDNTVLCRAVVQEPGK